jgi:D-lactate dehydrogenase (cytochrome)
VAAEHGIGKLKTGLLEILHGAEGVAAMRRLKTLFDPAGLLNRGTLFPPGD